VTTRRQTFASARRDAAFGLRHFERYALPAAYATLFIMCLHWVHPGAVIAQGDAPPIFDASIILQKLLDPWNAVSEYFGRLTSTFPFALFLAIEALLDKTIGPSYGQALMLFVILAAALEGMRRCALAIGCGPMPSLLAGVLYVLNPFTQITVWTFVTGNLLQAIIPWYLLWIVEGLRTQDRRRRQWLSLVAITSTVAIMPLVAITPQLLVEFVLLVGALAAILIRAFGLGSRAGFAWLTRTALLAILASLWWFVPELLAFVGVPSGRALAPTDNAWIYARSSILNTLRHNPAWFWGQPTFYPFAAAYDRNALTYAAGFAPYALMLGALLACRGPFLRLVRALTVLCVACVLIIKGVHEPLAGLDRAVLSLPVAFLFQESAGFSIVTLFCMILSASALFETLRRSERLRGAWPPLGSLTTVSAGLASLLMLTGAVFPDFYTGVPSKYVRLPKTYEAAERYIDGAPGAGGVLMLPADETYQSLYSWGYYGSDVFPDVILRRRVLIPSKPLGYIANWLQASVSQKIFAMMRDRSSRLEPLLHDIGIRFVVLRDDVVTDQQFRVDETTLRAALPGARIATFGPLLVFDLGAGRSRINAATRWIAGSYGDLQAADLVELRALSGLWEPRLEARDATLASGPPMLYEDGLNGRGSFADLPVSSQAAIARSPHALIWSGDEARFHGALTTGLNGESVRASFSRVPPLAPAPTLGIETGIDPSGSAAALVSVLAAPRSPLNEGQITVFNASPRDVKIGVRVQVYPRHDARFVLSGTYGEATDTLAGVVHPVWAEFRSVLVRPGINALSLAENRVGGRSATLPREAQTPDGQAPFVMLSAPPQPVSLARHVPLSSGSLVEFSDPRPALIGGWSLDARWRDEVYVRPEYDSSVITVQGTEATVLVDFAWGGKRYVCAATADASGVIALDGAIYDCLVMNGMRVTGPQFDSLRIRWVGFALTLAPGTVRSGGFVGFRALQVSARSNPFATPLGAANIGSDALTSEAFADGQTLISIARRTADHSPSLLGAQVTVTTTSGEVRGKIIAHSGSLVELVDEQGAHWIPLTSIKEIVAAGSATSQPAQVTLRWPLSFAAGRPLDVRISLSAATIAEPSVRVYDAGRRVSEVDLRPYVTQSGSSAFLELERRLRPASSRVRKGILEVRFSTAASETKPSSISAAAAVASSEPLVLAGDAAAANVERLIFEALAGNGAIRVDVRNRWPNLSLLEAGAPAGLREEDTGFARDTGWFIWGRAMPGDRMITLDEQYHPTWICIQPSLFAPIARHYGVDRWRNGWTVAGGAPFLIFNLASAFFAVALLVTIVLLARAWLAYRAGARSHPVSR
jgi:uncharacterized protein DUF3367